MTTGPDDVQQRLDEHEREVQAHLEDEVAADDAADADAEEAEAGEDSMEGEAPSG